MTLAEAEEGRRQLMRMRALQSYQADKLKRQNKIKSKKYRKLLRKSREKVSEVVSTAVAPMSICKSVLATLHLTIKIADHFN